MERIKFCAPFQYAHVSTVMPIVILEVEAASAELPKTTGRAAAPVRKSRRVIVFGIIYSFRQQVIPASRRCQGMVGCILTERLGAEWIPHSGGEMLRKQFCHVTLAIGVA